jgi:hypothetical protein
MSSMSQMKWLEWRSAMNDWVKWNEMKWNENENEMKWNEMKPNGLKLKGHSNDTEVKLNAWKKEWNNALKWNWNEIKLKMKGNKMKWNEMKCNERMKEWQNNKSEKACWCNFTYCWSTVWPPYWIAIVQIKHVLFISHYQLTLSSI